MKKTTKLLLGTFLGCLLIIYGFYFYQNYQKLQLKRINDAEKILLKEIKTELNYSAGHFRTITKNYAELELILFVPETESGDLLIDLNREMEKIAAEIIENKRDPDIKKIVLSAIPTEIQTNLTRYTVHQDNYRWEKLQMEWEKEQLEHPQKIVINNLTKSRLTFGDLFQNQKNLSTINGMIEDNLLSLAAEPANELEGILALPLLLENQANFDYETDQITINYEAKDSYVKQYVLKFDQVGHYLNPEFVQPEYLAAAPEPAAPLNSKVVALTFDDGPNDTTTPEILKILAKEKIHGTFFMLGQQVEKFPEMAQRVSQEGHELANHSYSHPNLVTLTPEDVRAQINKTQLAIFKATNVLPTYVRPPYGSFDYQTAIAINQPLVNWSVDSLDWKDHNAKKLVKRVESQLTNHGIILMHDIQPTTVEALPEVIKLLKAKGYEFATVSELVQQSKESLVVHYSGDDFKTINQ